MAVKIFQPAETLTFDTVQADSESLLKIFRDSEEDEICLDLSQVTQCDSAGLALLLEVKRLSKQYNKKLLIDAIPKSISVLAEFCGMDGMLKNDD